jgi:hypothetical protein
MKIAIVNLSEIAQTQNLSLAPEDYIEQEDYIKLLLARFSDADKKRLRSLIDRGVTTEERVADFAREMQDEILARPVLKVQKIDRNLLDLLG